MGCPHTVTFKVKFAIFQVRVFLHYKGTHLSVLIQHFCRIYGAFHILFKRIHVGISYFTHMQPKHIFFSWNDQILKIHAICFIVLGYNTLLYNFITFLPLFEDKQYLRWKLIGTRTQLSCSVSCKSTRDWISTQRYIERPLYLPCPHPAETPFSPWGKC